MVRGKMVTSSGSQATTHTKGSSCSSMVLGSIKKANYGMVNFGHGVSGNHNHE